LGNTENFEYLFFCCYLYQKHLDNRSLFKRKFNGIGEEMNPIEWANLWLKKMNFLVFEKAPFVNVTLQWATYRDASYQFS
jgi:hypothetical protein